MSKYKLDVCERIVKTHEVIIETDEEIGDICDEIERQHMLDVWDIQYINGVNVVKIVEDEDGMSEFEVEGISDDESFYDEVME
jgi:hypothetical protein